MLEMRAFRTGFVLLLLLLLFSQLFQREPCEFSTSEVVTALSRGPDADLLTFSGLNLYLGARLAAAALTHVLIHYHY